MSTLRRWCSVLKVSSRLLRRLAMEGTGEVHPAAGVRPQSAGSGAAAFGDLWPA